MKWVDALFRRPASLDPAQGAALAAYRSLEQPDLRGPLDRQRVVVVDVEASGLDPFNDRLISIAGVAVHDGFVIVGESFEVVLRQQEPSGSENILVHGIGSAAQRSGRAQGPALIEFLTFVGKAPLIAFSADFDRILIQKATRAAVHTKPDNVWLDLALLAPALFPDHAVARTLDDWIQIFGIENHCPHNAASDALATAELLLVVLAKARAQNLGAWTQLVSLQRDQRWLNSAAPGLRFRGRQSADRRSS